MGAHLFLISLYLATTASFAVLGISLLGSVSPLGAGARAAAAFVAFTLLGLLAKSLMGDQAATGEMRGQQVDLTLPPTAPVVAGERTASARGEAGGRRA
jgi:hypothetical protein